MKRTETSLSGLTPAQRIRFANLGWNSEAMRERMLTHRRNIEASKDYHRMNEYRRAIAENEREARALFAEKPMPLGKP